MKTKPVLKFKVMIARNIYDFKVLSDRNTYFKNRDGIGYLFNQFKKDGYGYGTLDYIKQKNKKMIKHFKSNVKNILINRLIEYTAQAFGKEQDVPN